MKTSWHLQTSLWQWRQADTYRPVSDNEDKLTPTDQSLTMKTGWHLQTSLWQWRQADTYRPVSDSEGRLTPTDQSLTMKTSWHLQTSLWQWRQADTYRPVSDSEDRLTQTSLWQKSGWLTPTGQSLTVKSWLTPTDQSLTVKIGWHLQTSLWQWRQADTYGPVSDSEDRLTPIYR